MARPPPTLPGVPRRRPLLGLVAALVVLGGCRVDATVEARVSGAGGTVTARFVLDREAVAVLGGAVGEGAQTSDLARPGWEISPVRSTSGGGAEVEATKEFSRPGDLAVVIGELAGPAGPLRDFRLDRRRSFAKASYRLRGTADLGAGAAAATGFANAPDLTGPAPRRRRRSRPGRGTPGRAGGRGLPPPAGRRPSRGDDRRFEVPAGVAAERRCRHRRTSDRARPVLLAVAVLTGLIVLLRLRRRTPQT